LLWYIGFICFPSLVIGVCVGIRVADACVAMDGRGVGSGHRRGLWRMKVVADGDVVDDVDVGIEEG